MLIKLAIAEIKIALYYYPDAPPTNYNLRLGQ